MKVVREYRMGNTDIEIFPLSGNRRNIKEWAELIADLIERNDYVMGFDKDDEIVWTVQSDDNRFNSDWREEMTWTGVERVEVWSPYCDNSGGRETVYYSHARALKKYFDNRADQDIREVR